METPEHFHPPHETSTEYHCTLSEVDARRAEEELNEHHSNRMIHIANFRHMITNAGDLRCPTDPLFLLRFLRAKKFDVNRAYACIRRYYEVRRQHPDIFKDFHPLSVRHALDEKIVSVLSEPDAKGRRVILIKPGFWHPEVTPLSQLMRAILISLEWLLRDESFQVNGLVLFVDCANLGMKQYRQLNRDRIRLLMFLVQEAFPVRLKAVHIMNAPALLQYLLKIVMFFLKDKLKQRIQVHGFRLYGLFEDLGEFAIPESYGGRLIMDADWWRDQLFSNEADTYYRHHLSDGIIGGEGTDDIPIITIDNDDHQHAHFQEHGVSLSH